MMSGLFSGKALVWACVWQSTACVAVGLIISSVLRRRPARAHQVLLLAMIAAVIVPIMSTLVRHYGWGVFVAEPLVVQPQPEDWPPVNDYETLATSAPDAIEPAPYLVPENSAPPMVESEVAAEVVSEKASFPWRSVLLYGWVAASSILAARLIVTFMLGIRLLRRAQPSSCKRIKQALRIARAKLGINEDVHIYRSDRICSPMIWCWRSTPVLLVPTTLGQSDNGVDWTSVLCHELAHYKRWDHISGLLAELVACALPWNPLLWCTKRRLVRLSEQVCDDWVVASGQTRTDYAESLLDLAPGGQMAFVPAVVSSKKGLAGRVHRILRDKCTNPRAGLPWALAVSIVALCVAAGIAFAQTRPASMNVAKIEAPPVPEALKNNVLPVDWRLDYDNGVRPDGSKHWLSNMAQNLASLKVVPKPVDPLDVNWKNERYDFNIRSLQGKEIGNVYVRPGYKLGEANSKILKPDKYLLTYTRERGKHPDNFKMRCGEFLVDLSQPGMYELKFTPKLGTVEITGSLGGCYALNFEKVGKGAWIRGFAYQYPSKQYILDGLPAGKYRLSAVTQRKSCNVLVSQAEVTVGAKDKRSVNIVPAPTGSCSLKGNIRGKQEKYKTPWPKTWPESEGKWYILIRTPDSGEIGRVDAYEALTMDTLYVVRGPSIVQETKDRARYHIEGVAPGKYTVTAIENPSWSGCVVARQQSKALTLRAGDEAVLHFDLQGTKEE